MSRATESGYSAKVVWGRGRCKYSIVAYEINCSEEEGIVKVYAQSEEGLKYKICETFNRCVTDRSRLYGDLPRLLDTTYVRATELSTFLTHFSSTRG